MRSRHQNRFVTVQSEGALLPPDLLARIAEGDTSLPGLRPADYHLTGNEKLNEAINHSWNRLVAAWASFKTAHQDIPVEQPGTTETREHWLLPLFQELGYGRLQTKSAFEVEGKSYPISHAWEQVPIHLVGCNIRLDRRTPGVAGASRTSPHSLVQEFLNRAEGHLWGFVSNGLQLRVLRDNVSLTRQAYLEFDLQAMMDGEAYADFALLWLICHQSRVEGPRAQEFWLERWCLVAQERGTRALENLRNGVEQAIVDLGSGFLAHSANTALVESLRSGQLTRQDYYRQLLRLVYRLIFLFVAEDRELLHPPDSDLIARKRYQEYYSTQRLRSMAARRSAGRHADLYHTLRLVTARLGSQNGAPELALPSLGSFLFSTEATKDLNVAELPNHSLLDALRALAYTAENGVLRPVDYRNLGPEELGSVYESLLELHPELNIDAHVFKLATATGNERKTSGSYYTPSYLIQVLLDSALEPVIREALKQEDSQAALLNLKICDPACGSGHFLLSAAHRIAKRLAALRSGDEEPAPEATREALRDVVARCVFGVDINEMAVELCKVGLWMESLAPGKPLTFLDSQIKCGNSLVGVGPGMDIREIPDAAFQPAFGDDRATATALRRRNRREREGQLGLRWNITLIQDQDELQAWLESKIRTFGKMPQGDLAEVLAKEKTYSEILKAEDAKKRQLEFDLWTAAFFWPIPSSDAETILAPTQQELLALRAEQALDTTLVHRIASLAQEQRFFHWPFEFPHVFSEGGGFDCMIGNPPWERIKLQEQEFFAGVDDEIAQAPNKAARQRLINKLEQDENRQVLWGRFVGAKAAAENDSYFVRQSGRYPLTGIGDVNTYALFAELARQIISAWGQAGVIVPTGIATDDTTKLFFADLIQKHNLVSLFDFENKEAIFPGVHRSYKFCLLTLSGKPVEQGEFVFFATQVEHLKDERRRFSLTPDDIALFNPNTKTMPIFRTHVDAELARKIYQRVPVLHNEETGENPWAISFLRMFDMSNDSHLFATEPRDGYVPLYEDWMINYYDHRCQSDGGHETRIDQYLDPRFSATPRYWVSEVEVNKRLLGVRHSRYFLGFRNRARNTDLRSAIVSCIPFSAIGNTTPVISSNQENDLLLIGNMSSLVFDFLARLKIPGMNLNFFIFKQFPLLTLAQYSIEALFSICPRVLELIYTSWDMLPFANNAWEASTPDLQRAFAAQWEENALLRKGREELREVVGLSNNAFPYPPFLWDEERRFMLRAELDAHYARLYGLTREELRYILDPQDVYGLAFPGETFRVLKEREIQSYGEYRTQRLVLEAWDRLEEEVGRIVPASPSIPVEVPIRPITIQQSIQSWEPLPPAYRLPEASQWAEATRQTATIAWLIKNYGNQGKTLSNYKSQKFSYFLQRSGLVDAAIEYKEFARGPYSPQVTYKAGASAKKRNYWEARGSNIVARRNINEAVRNAEEILADQRKAVDLLDRLVSLSDEDLGGLATIDFASRAIHEQEMAISPQNIRQYFQTAWTDKAGDPWYTDENILQALELLVALELFQKQDSR